MKCPLKHTLEEATTEKRIWVDDDCLVEKCAWWHRAKAQCIVKSIESDLRGIEIEISTIADRLSSKRTI